MKYFTSFLLLFCDILVRYVSFEYNNNNNNFFSCRTFLLLSLLGEEKIKKITGVRVCFSI